MFIAIFGKNWTMSHSRLFSQLEQSWTQKIWNTITFSHLIDNLDWKKQHKFWKQMVNSLKYKYIFLLAFWCNMVYVNDVDSMFNASEELHNCFCSLPTSLPVNRALPASSWQLAFSGLITLYNMICMFSSIKGYSESYLKYLFFFCYL